MRLREKGCHPGSGSVHCSRREPAGGTSCPLKPTARGVCTHRWNQGIGRDPNPVGVLAPADLPASIQETHWRQMTLVPIPDLNQVTSVSPSTE